MFFRFGFSGNQPLATRFSCSKSSRIDQKQENAATPQTVDQTKLSKMRERAAKPRPASRNTHQQPLPKWYSAFMTIGWHIPMIRNVASPTISPEKFISIFLRAAKIGKIR